MCGILGVVGQMPDEAPGFFQRALDKIAHRGPDAEGIWQSNDISLGHRRLAIIDLSEDGNQPMIELDSGLVIVFNGEIYNYLELRSELVGRGYRFRTKTDTEVLLKGYLEWGMSLFDKCNGMWAFAIWDPKSRRLLLARDRFGVKPLYYAALPEGLLFASEPKALHSIDRRLTTVDSNAIIDFVVNSRSHVGARTFYRSIQALPPAHYAVYDQQSHQFSLHRYWDYPGAQADGTADNSLEKFSELFVDAVRLRFRSDVPVGLSLSGGLDSSAVLAASTEFPHNPIRSYTSVYSSKLRNEEHWAERAAGYARLKVDPVEANVNDWWETLKRIVDYMDSPGFSPAVFPLWAIMARARDDRVPVLLEGQGADELLAGYPRYTAIEALSSLKGLRIPSFLRGFLHLVVTSSLTGAAGWLSREAVPTYAKELTRRRRRELFHPELIDGWRKLAPDPTVSQTGELYDPLRKALWQDHSQDILPALLHYGDSISMAHGIESRLPFMDYRLVEWVFRDSPQLIRATDTKYPIRCFLRSRRFDAIAERKDKQGYATPIMEWYQSVGNQYLNDMIIERSAPIWDYFNPDLVRELAVSAQNGSTYGMFHLYKIITIYIWLSNLKNRS